MDDSNKPGNTRKRKIDEEADETNAALREALGPRRPPVPERARGDKKAVPRPAAGLAKRKAAQPPKRKVADLSQLRRLVDGRVSDWKSKQHVGKQAWVEQSSHEDDSQSFEGPRRSPYRRQAAWEPTPSVKKNGGRSRRFIDEAISASKTNGKPEMKLEDFSTHVPDSGSRKHLSRYRQSRETSRFRQEDFVSVKIEEEVEEVVANEDQVGLQATDHERDVYIKREPSPSLAVPDREDSSSDEGGILEIVDTRKKR